MTHPWEFRGFQSGGDGLLAARIATPHADQANFRGSTFRSNQHFRSFVHWGAGRHGIELQKISQWWHLARPQLKIDATLLYEAPLRQ
jgi:hypothetical protein